MIIVDELTKRFGAHAAVEDVTFSCAPGTVTGFLGPNGAGKSTTLRLLCGLSTPTAGRATVLGVPFRELPNPGRRVGVLLDASAQHAGRSGREALTLAALTLGVERERVDELLERVGLRAAARRRVGTYSLGMRSGWASRTPCSATPRSSSSTSPPTGSIPRASTGCAACCATSPTAAGPSCCPRTSCTRSRPSPTAS